MGNQYRLGNRENEESSRVGEARHLGYMRAINNSSDNHSTSSAQRLLGSSLNGVVPATEHNYQRSGVASGNNSVANSIGGINTTTTAAGTRSDDVNSSLKRSRTTNGGESFSEGDGSSRRRRRLITFPPSPIQDINNMFNHHHSMNEVGVASNTSQINSVSHGFFEDHNSSHRQEHPSPAFDEQRMNVESRRWDRVNRFLHPTSRSENSTRPGGSNSISISTSPQLRPERITLREELSNTLQHLRNGGSVRIEDLVILDYAIVLNLLDSQELIDQLNDSENWPYEIIWGLENQVGSTVETGLTEQEIWRYILQETYHVNLEETCTLNQTCTICQEDYVEGERIGRVDCMHIFHLDCIKQWLEQKNVCPICNQTALEIDESEDE